MNNNIFDFVSVDTETTGLYPNYGDKIIQLSAVKYKDGNKIDEFNQYINPLEKTNGAFTVNGIRDSFLTDKPSLKKVIPQFNNFVGNMTWVGHNINFDLNFLSYEGVNVEKVKTIDTLKMARARFGMKGNKLWQLQKKFGLANKKQHDSLEDSKIVARLYLKLLNIKPLPKKKYKHTYKKHVVVSANDDMLSNAKIVFTGKIDGYNRDELRHLVESHGGKSPDSVSRVTDYLILGTQTSKTKVANHSQKEINAIKFGVPIISFAEFEDMLGE